MPRLTVAQALLQFLANQWTVDGDHSERLIPETLGIFGHGNVAGIGQALKQSAMDDPAIMPYHQGFNEQAMVHQAVAFARMRRRRAALAVTASVGPGSTNMLTGAAVATVNRLPVLLLPSDTFATRTADPVLQQLEVPQDGSISVNDAFKPLSRYFDRISRPEQLFSASLAAMRVLTDPVETGAVTLSLPEDVQSQALEVPEEFLARREWRIRRPLPEHADLIAVVDAIKSAKAPVIVAGGGVIYSDAADALRAFAEKTGIPIATTQAGGGSIPWDHRLALGGVGATGTTAANRLVAVADLIIGIGTRYSDFTTASRTAFQNPRVRFVNINVASFDAIKLGASVSMVADAREALRALEKAIERIVIDDRAEQIAAERASWDSLVDAAFEATGDSVPGQPEIIGAVNRASDPRDVVICAAGSLPGDLHKLWRVRDDLGYHVEYGYSTMGYEIAAGLGVRRAAPDRDPIVMVGDGSYLMLHTELLTAVAEGLKVIVVLIQNHGYASIGHLSETVGSDRYGTRYRYRDHAHNDVDRFAPLPIDLAANAASLGVRTIRVDGGPSTIADLESAIATAKASDGPTLIHVETDPLSYAPDGDGWWEVPVAEVSTLNATTLARQAYELARTAQRPLLGPSSDIDAKTS